MTDTDFYSPREAAAYLASRGMPFSAATLAKYRCLGGGPKFVKIGPGVGARVRYQKAALDEWLTASCRELASTSAAA